MGCVVCNDTGWDGKWPCQNCRWGQIEDDRMREQERIEDERERDGKYDYRNGDYE